MSALPEDFGYEPGEEAAIHLATLVHAAGTEFERSMRIGDMHARAETRTVYYAALDTLHWRIERLRDEQTMEVLLDSGEPVPSVRTNESLAQWVDRMAHDMPATPSPSQSAPALPPVEGDLLPPIGSKVLIQFGGKDEWAMHTVVGYYVLEGGHGAAPVRHHVHVRIRADDGTLTSRALSDIRYPGETS